MKYEIQTLTNGRICGRTSLTGVLHLADSLSLDAHSLSFTVDREPMSIKTEDPLEFGGWDRNVQLVKQVLWTKDMKGNLLFHTEAINELVDKINKERESRGVTEKVSFF